MYRLGLRRGLLQRIARTDLTKPTQSRKTTSIRHLGALQKNAPDVWREFNRLSFHFILGRGGALVESTDFNRIVVGSTPALAAT